MSDWHKVNQDDRMAKRREIDRLRQLISRAVHFTHGWEEGQPRWSAVGCTFSLGSTSAAELCREFGVDPNELRSPCVLCGAWTPHAQGVTDPACDNCVAAHAGGAS